MYYKKRKMIISLIITILLVLTLVPKIFYLKDGGTIRHEAMLYQIIKWHAMRGVRNTYYIGLEVKVLGITIYNDAKEIERK